MDLDSYILQPQQSRSFAEEAMRDRLGEAEGDAVKAGGAKGSDAAASQRDELESSDNVHKL